MNDEDPGRFANLKPRLLRHAQPHAADQNPEDQDSTEGYEDGSYADGSTLH
jgi:hypothetical protein